MADLRIDELARRGGTTVRNVRAYQDRGLLPPPRREGRVGWYGPEHLARLRLIGALLERGYTLSNIGELLAVWEKGQDLRHLLGFETELLRPWRDEPAAHFTLAQLEEMFGAAGPQTLADATKLGLLVPAGDGFDTDRPETVRAAATLVELGVPLPAVFTLGEQLAAAADDIARAFVGVVVDNLLEPDELPLPPADVDRLAETVGRLRPLARAVVDAEVAHALEQRIAAELSDHLTRRAPAEAPAEDRGGAPGKDRGGALSEGEGRPAPPAGRRRPSPPPRPS